MFNPIARDHSDKGTRLQEPFVDGEAHLAIRRRFIEERYRLMPYIYTLAEEASRTGLPMMRPLFMEFPDAAGGYPLDLEDGSQFMWGPSMLVAPAPFPETLDDYAILLPPGDWYDYWSGARIDDPAPAKLTGGSGAAMDFGSDPAQQPYLVRHAPKLDELPVFVRAGSIIPRQPLVQSTAETPQGALELAIYPGPDCKGSVYLDDGISFDYRDGGFLRMDVRCEVSVDGAISVGIDRIGNLDPWWDRIEFVVHGIESFSPLASVNGVPAVDVHHDRDNSRICFSTAMPPGSNTRA